MSPGGKTRVIQWLWQLPVSNKFRRPCTRLLVTLKTRTCQLSRHPNHKRTSSTRTNCNYQIHFLDVIWSHQNTNTCKKVMHSYSWEKNHLFVHDRVIYMATPSWLILISRHSWRRRDSRRFDTLCNVGKGYVESIRILYATQWLKRGTLTNELTWTFW